MRLSVRAQERLVRMTILLVVGGVVGGLLWMVGKAVRDQERHTALQTTLQSAKDAVERLAQDTGEHPAHTPLTPCVADREVSLEQCEAGVVCSDGRFPNWRGPYLSQVPRDSWGTVLRFDPDYACTTSIAGCEGKEGWVRAIVAAGPDRQFDTPDDVVAVLCRE